MKRLKCLFFLILFFTVSYSQETVRDYFFKQMDLTPELIKKLRSRPKTDISYNFVKYKIKNETLFNKIAEVSINSIKKELSKRKKYKDGVSISFLKMYVIKIKGIIYLCVEYNPYAKYRRPNFPMKQSAGFTSYRGVTYELRFWDLVPTLFEPTKQFRRIVYKNNVPTMHFESAEIYLQIKGNDVKEVGGEMIIN